MEYPHYAVLPGPQGPVNTPRWQAAGQSTEDIALLSTTEYLLGKYTGKGKADMRKKFSLAQQHGQDGNFYQMRQLLRAILEDTGSVARGR